MPLDGTQLGHYRLLRLIGSGGMGEVYLGEDTRIHRQVAIKVVRAEAAAYPDASATKESARLFQREMRAVATLDHPHILPLFDFGEEVANKMTLTYMVMPLRQEGSLADWLQQRTSVEKLSPEDVAHFIYQAADALQHAHDHQLIHQDVKPANFLIRGRKDTPLRPDVLLADFGIAKFTTATATASQSSRGTAAYMAPEQWDGQPVAASDQYALAVMAYQLLTGRPPFLGGQGYVMRQHFSTQPQPPSTLNPDISPAIDAVILRALAKQPEDRFGSIADFARGFQEALQSSDMSTLVKTPQSNELHATLAISEVEARTGTNRTLTLPSGRQVTVSVPAGAYNGQIICLKGQGEPSGDGRSLGALVLTLEVKHIAEDALPSSSSSNERTIPVSTPNFSGAQDSIKRQGFFGVKSIVLIGLVLLVLIASISAFSLLRNNPIASNNANATITAQANEIVTTQANNPTTATTQGNGTTTSITQANATATFIAVNPDPYPPNSGRLVLNDPLSDNNRGYNWDLKPTSFGTCTFNGAAYHAAAPGSSTYHRCIAQSTNFSNFAYQVEMVIIAGNCGAIIFRADAYIFHYYYFRLCQDGSYALWLYTQQSGPQTKTFLQGTSPTIHTGLGQSNLIAVVANNDYLALYVNHQLINSLHDSTYSQGQIGVAADNDNSPTEVAFSNAKVWTL